MVNCAVLTCKNDSRRQTKQNSNITFHRFPKNEELLRKWVQALHRADWEPTVPSFVCSGHFHQADMYFSKSGLRRLTATAVPALGIHNVSPPPRSRRNKKSRTYSPDEKERQRRSIKKEAKKKLYAPKDSDSSVHRKLKKRIADLTEVSKRRRLRCNALYASLNRIRKKLQQRAALSGELSAALGACGLSADELLRGLRGRGRGQGHAAHHHHDWEVEVPPAWQPPPRLVVYSTSYPSAAPSPHDGGQPQVSVKDEHASSPRVAAAPLVPPEPLAECHLSTQEAHSLFVDV